MSDPIRELADALRDVVANDPYRAMQTSVFEGILRDAGVTLEGGGQDAMPQDRAGNQGPADPARAAAPDQPHEFNLGHISAGEDFCVCGRTIDDPIHDVRDSRTENEVNDDTVCGHPPTQTCGPECGVYVTAGDEVVFDMQVAFVVGPFANPKYDDICIEVHNATRPQWTKPAHLRTPDGRPVLGYRERHEYEYGRRIAELERELDEARQDRDAADTAAGRMGRELEKVTAERDALRNEVRGLRLEKLEG